MAENLKLVLEGDASSLKAALQETFGGLDKVDKKVTSGIPNWLKWTAAGAAATAAMKFAISTTAKFESSISDLSAITGASGKDLEFLSDAAKEMGATTTKSASEAAEAMKLMASAKPDLLESAEALASVTKEALTLAEAAGATLPEAANTLGASLNQFGAEADQASRFINVLAAGAKEGASEIRETSAALKESGTVASAAGISFEETNAAIQTLSTVAIKGGQAGTNLRNIILKLQTQTEDGYNPAVVGLSQALKNLQNDELDTTELTKLFGLESVTAAQTLIKQADSVETLTGKLTDTSTAYDQAAIKTDNMTGDMAALTSAVEGAAIEFGEELGPSIRDAIQTSTKLIGDMVPVAIATAQAIVIAFKPVTVMFEALAEGISAFQAGAEASNSAVNGVIESAKAFNKVLKPNRDLLAEIGINLKDIDPRDVDAVNAAMAALNKHSKEANIELVTRNKLSKEFQVVQEEIIATEEKAATVKEEGVSSEIQKEIDAQAAKYVKLREMAEEFQLSEQEREVARFERENEQFNLDLEKLVENGIIVDEAVATQNQARADAEAIHQENLSNIETDAKSKTAATIAAMEKTAVAQSLALGDQLVGESAAGQAVLLAIRAGIAINETIINTQVAGIRALAELGPILGPPAVATINAMGAASVGLIGASAVAEVAGIAHDGLDRNPSEGTFLLKRDEMVLDSGTSQAVREAAVNGASGGGSITIGDIILNTTLTVENAKEYVRETIIPQLKDAIRDGEFGGKGAFA